MIIKANIKFKNILYKEGERSGVQSRNNESKVHCGFLGIASTCHSHRFLLRFFWFL